MSILSRNLIIKNILAVILYLAALVIFVGFAWLICSRFVWYADNPIYWILQGVKEYLLVFIIIFALAGWILISAYFIRKPFHYLDEVVGAAEKLAQPVSEPILLSQELSYTENELNRVREQALENVRMLKEAEQRKNDLVVYLAHDLKTPLTSVLGYLTLLKEEGKISEELREKYLSIALSKAQRLEDLINDFFEITRFNLSDITLEMGRVNLTRLLEQLVFEFKPMFLEKNLDCHLIADGDIMIKCDVDKIQRVFDNLLRNAVNYSYENTDITIRVKNETGMLHILFENHGNTIPKEKLERIFEQFYRLDTARTTQNGGAGLGLAIAKEIVQKHHGSIRAESEQERIVFEVLLPQNE